MERRVLQKTYRVPVIILLVIDTPQRYKTNGDGLTIREGDILTGTY